MALKNVCLVPRDWTMDDYRAHTCDDGSHSHLSASQLRKHESQDLVRVIVRAGATSPRTIVVRKPAYRDGMRITVVPSLRDRSCRVGEPLAVALKDKLLWAAVMLADIKRRDVPELHDRELAGAPA